LLFNKWLLFLFILLHLPPHHLTISCFCNLSHHVTVFPFPCWHCLILSFRQVEVWFLTHSLVHPPLFIFPWIIERRVKSWLTPMGWFPLQLLYWYLTLFLHGTGVLWGISPLLTAPGPLLFLEPHFSFGMLAIPICSVANFPSGLPPSSPFVQFIWICIPCPTRLDVSGAPPGSLRLSAIRLLSLTHQSSTCLSLVCSFTTPQNLPFLQLSFPLSLYVFLSNCNPPSQSPIAHTRVFSLHLFSRLLSPFTSFISFFFSWDWNRRRFIILVRLLSSFLFV